MDSLLYATNTSDLKYDFELRQFRNNSTPGKSLGNDLLTHSDDEGDNEIVVALMASPANRRKRGASIQARRPDEIPRL
jgi:hypothetical protein